MRLHGPSWWFRRYRWLKRCNARWPEVYEVCDLCEGDWAQRSVLCPNCDHGYIGVEA